MNAKTIRHKAAIEDGNAQTKKAEAEAHMGKISKRLPKVAGSGQAHLFVVLVQGFMLMGDIPCHQSIGGIELVDIPYYREWLVEIKRTRPEAEPGRHRASCGVPRASRSLPAGPASRLP